MSIGRFATEHFRTISFSIRHKQKKRIKRKAGFTVVIAGITGLALTSLIGSSAAASNTGGKAWHPFINSVYALTGVEINNPASLLGSNLSGLRLLLTDRKSVLSSTLDSAFAGTPSTTQPVSVGSHTGDKGLSSVQPKDTDKLSGDKNAGQAPANHSSQPPNPLVYIYHTHNWESFLPDLNKDYLDPKLAVDHKKINITLVGARLATALYALSVPTVQTAVDYWEGGFNAAYDNSRKTAVEELKKYPSIQIVFDIHRDDGPRELTTANYKGKPYARVFWIIGGSNPKYKVNEDFAKRLNDEFNKMYPAEPGQKALSRGVEKQFYPQGSEYNSLFNQDLKPNDVLIEIGGPQNSLEECYRTADLLAKTIKSVADSMNLSQSGQAGN